MEPTALLILHYRKPHPWIVFKTYTNTASFAPLILCIALQNSWNLFVFCLNLILGSLNTLGFMQVLSLSLSPLPSWSIFEQEHISSFQSLFTVMKQTMLSSSSLWQPSFASVLVWISLSLTAVTKTIIIFDCCCLRPVQKNWYFQIATGIATGRKYLKINASHYNI